MTMQLVETKTLGSTTASVEFTNIPQDATDLLLAISARGNGGSIGIGALITLNSSTTGFSGRILEGDGGSVYTNTLTREATYVNAASAAASTFGNAFIYFPNYTSSATKSFISDFVAENTGSSSRHGIIASAWTGTSAISSIALTPDAGVSFEANSMFTLYKITKA